MAFALSVAAFRVRAAVAWLVLLGLLTVGFAVVAPAAVEVAAEAAAAVLHTARLAVAVGTVVAI